MYNDVQNSIASYQATTAILSSVVSTVFSLVAVVLLIIAQWKIFTKAGEKGWKSLIPFYSGYILFKLTWETKWYWIALVLSFVASIIYSIAGACMAMSYFVIGAILVVIAVILFIALFVISILSYVKLSKAFGHGGGFAVGLIFLNFIFMLILAFGSSRYVGNPSNPNNSNNPYNPYNPYNQY